MTYLKEAHTRNGPESSFEEETLNFKVINGELGDRELRLVEAASLTKGFSFIILKTTCLQCILETLGRYATPIAYVFQPQ